VTGTFDALLKRMQELRDLSGLIGLAIWDQQTYLPPKASEARGLQLATIQGNYHERLVDPALGELLEDAQTEPLEADHRAMVRVLSRERDRSMRVPPSLVRALAEAQARGFSAWQAARQERSFALFSPALKSLLELRRQQADAIGHAGERYDALLDGYEPGLTVARLTPVLMRLKEGLVPMVRALAGAPQPDDVLSGRRFEAGAQLRFTRRVLEEMGFDFGAGRQDESIHPFSGGTHPRDVRLTTRVDEEQLPRGVLASIHEGGHGLYEQGFLESDHRTPLAAAPSAGLHESQSRLWENLVGRSRPFWRRFFPLLQQHFPHVLNDVTAEAFYRAINRVGPTLIRGQADEVTYNLHIVLRFELELLLIRDALPLDHLPGEWNRRMTELLGVTPPTDAAGVLQDVHWSAGDFGYFPTYALGNLYSASLFAALRHDVTDLDDRIEGGELQVITHWSREKVHSQGARLDAEDLIQRVCGHGLRDDDFIGYLKSKYSELYGVAL
jgi:carboxypeptidase Taq